MSLSARKAVTSFVLLAFLALYVWGAATLGGWLVDHAPQIVTLAFFALAGIAWVAPLRPLFAWMHTGSFTAPLPKRQKRRRRTD